MQQHREFKKSMNPLKIVQHLDENIKLIFSTIMHAKKGSFFFLKT